MDFPKLNLPPINLRVRRVGSGEQIEVWDRLRSKYLRLTGEEWVRQHILEMLISGYGVPAQLIVCEYSVGVNSLSQRADVVVLSPSGEPRLLVECKASDIAVDKDVMMQAQRYNSVLKAPYLLLSNGLVHSLFKRSDGGYTSCELSELDIFG